MKSFLIFIIIVLVLIIAGTIVIQFKDAFDIEMNAIDDAAQHIEDKEKIEVELPKEVQTFKENSRPIAVMLDNVGDARPQAGLNDAYMVYEIIVEGQLTRLMAVFKDVDLAKIGPIRSSRHYFLDYALENDAIYVHFGWSPKAQSDISKLDVDNINGLVESSKSFWRVRDKSAPHNVVTSTEKISAIAKRKKYDTTSEKESVLNYVTDEVELTEGIGATEITIPYSTTYKVTYKYDEETGRYTRGYNKTIQKDWDTEELVTTKNIIITFAKNYTMTDGSNKGRQDIVNVGTLKGYYITNGKAIEIECYKSSRKAQTIYRDLEGNEIKVNDGNTFVQIVPINAKVKIEGPEEIEDVENITENSENAIIN